MSITFTQYHRPTGRTSEMKIRRPIHIERLANAFISRGGRFTIEQIDRGGLVNITAEYLGRDVAVELISGSTIAAGVDRLVTNAATRINANAAG